MSLALTLLRMLTVIVVVVGGASACGDGSIIMATGLMTEVTGPGVVIAIPEGWASEGNHEHVIAAASPGDLQAATPTSLRVSVTPVGPDLLAPTDLFAEARQDQPSFETSPEELDVGDHPAVAVEFINGSAVMTRSIVVSVDNTPYDVKFEAPAGQWDQVQELVDAITESVHFV
ncbi:MAG: hypothetical protein LC808_27405 [Actinobacteria bacterium]|nr:hypothetical protein [Actinomycetota bacterium]